MREAGSLPKLFIMQHKKRFIDVVPAFRSHVKEMGLNTLFLEKIDASIIKQLCNKWVEWKETSEYRTEENLYEEDISFLRYFGELFGKEYYEGKGSISPYIIPYRWNNYDRNLVHFRLKGIINSVSMKSRDSVLDFGCGVGFYIKGLLEMGFNPVGIESSMYAIENCHPLVRNHIHPLSSTYLKKLLNSPVRLLIAKDVLEHIPTAILPRLWKSISRCAEQFVVVVPFVDKQTRRYVNTEDEHDLTHVVRKTREEWFELLGSSQTDEDLAIILKSDKAKGTLCIIGAKR